MDFQTFEYTILEGMRPYTYLILLGGITSVGVSLMVSLNNEIKRDALIKFLYIIFAILMLQFSVVMAGDIQDVIVKYSSSAISDTTSPANGGLMNDLAPVEFMDNIGLGERVLISIIEVVAFSMEAVKNWFVGEAELKELLFDGSKDVFISYKLPLVDGGTFDLYEFMLSITGVFIFLFLVRRAYKIIKAVKLEDAEMEVKTLLMDLLLVTARIIIVPSVVLLMVLFVNSILSQFSQVEVTSYNAIKNYSAYEYGLGISVAKIYIIVLEMKLYLIMLFRKYMLSGLIIIAPIAIAVKEVNEDFTSFESWLSFTIKFIFLPLYYSLNFLLAVLMINNISNSNPLTSVVIYSFIFRGVDILVSIFILKNASRDSNKTPGLNIIGAMMAARTVNNLVTGPGKSLLNLPSTAEKGKALGQMIRKNMT